MPQQPAQQPRYQVHPSGGHGRPQGQAGAQSRADIVLENHNQAISVQERITNSLVVKGHNNQVQCLGKVISTTVYGHNNLVYAQQGQGQTPLKFESMIV